MEIQQYINEVKGKLNASSVVVSVEVVDERTSRSILEIIDIIEQELSSLE